MHVDFQNLLLSLCLFDNYLIIFQIVSNDKKKEWQFDFEIHGMIFGRLLSVSALCVPLSTSFCALPLLLLCARLVTITISSYYYWILSRDWKPKDHWRLYRQKVYKTQHQKPLVPSLLHLVANLFIFFCSLNLVTFTSFLLMLMTFNSYVFFDISVFVWNGFLLVILSPSLEKP